MLFNIDFKNDKHISALIDILRGLAIILVLIVHTHNFIQTTGNYGDNLNQLQRNLFNLMLDGSSGVALFFVISGFLMDYLYKNRLNVKHFALKRLARIFPAWLLWNLVALAFATLGLAWQFKGGQDIMHKIYGSVQPITDLHTLGMFLASVFFLGWVSLGIWNLYVPGGWSIQAEMSHYAVFPILNKINTSVILLLCLILQGIGVYFGTPFEQPIRDSFITSPFWFVLGLVISRVVRNHRNGERIISPIEFGLLALNFVLTYNLRGPAIVQSTSMLVLFISIALSFIIFRVNVLSKTIKAIGKYSYGMYFNHFLFGIPLGFLFSSWISRYNLYGFTVIITLLAIIILSYISFIVAKIMYNYYEKFFIAKANAYAAKESQ
jgi:exopolysaccharide production protein ExoZ